VKALRFRYSPPRLAAAKLGGFFTPRAFVSALGPTRLEEVPEPEAPAGWVPCDTLVAGICGSDSKQVFLNGARDNPLTGLISFPHVLGHEAVGRRRDTGARVVLDPWLGCAARGLTPCEACRHGQQAQCRRFAEGTLQPALHLGNSADRGGVHAERFAAHASQLHPVPETVSTEAAVLADPVSVSLRHVLRTPPDPRRPALVYGCGTLGLCAIALLRHLHPGLEIWAVSRPGKRGELARKLGASRLLVGRPDDHVGRVAELLGVAPITPWSGRSWLQDGPAVVYDTVGSPESVETSLRLVATGGSIAVSGVEAPRRFEWTPLYFKEVSLRGSNAFGVERLRGVEQHAFAHYFDLLAEGFDVSAIITHRFPLARWRDAYLTIARRSRTGAVKVLLEPGAG
jgi:threonine dehydrogenase-like Zn-dependent dehydrogenase